MINLSQLTLEVVKVKSGRYPLEKRIGSPDDIYETFKAVLKMDCQSEELFAIIALDTKFKVIGIFEVSRGTLNSALVHPREVFKRALMVNAHAIALSHNHPSGDPTPSPEDIQLTKRLVEAGTLLGVQVIDHVVIGDNQYESFKESGLI